MESSHVLQLLFMVRLYSFEICETVIFVAVSIVLTVDALRRFLGMIRNGTGSP